MKIEVRGENYNRLLKRKEVDFFIDHTEEPTPAMAAVQQLLAKQMSVDVQSTEIKEIMTSRGLPGSVCKAFVWDQKTVKDLSQKEEAKLKSE